MNEQLSFNTIDSLLIQCALQTRELSQKKNEINQQIKVCRADIAERKSYIETIQRNIKKLDDEIRMKQSSLTHNKTNAKSMKATNAMLHQYEQTLKEELESRKASYNSAMEVYDNRMASYKKTFQTHEEYYCQDPFAQKLLGLLAEKLEIELRIKALSDEITMKRTALDKLMGPAISSSPTEELPESVSSQQPIKEPEKQLDPHIEEDGDCSMDVSLHLSQTKNDQKTSTDANAEEPPEGDEAASTCSLVPEEQSSELWSCQRVDEQMSQDGMHAEEPDQESEDQVLEQQTTASSEEEKMEQEETEGRAAIEEEEAPSKEDSEGFTTRPRSAHQTHPQFSTAAAVLSTPTFPFDSSPDASPHHGISDTKSPAFSFSMNSDPGTPGFSGFGFDAASPQDEDSSFAFTSSFFNDKKTAESKSSRCPEFLFGQPEQSEDFQFAFTSKSPQAANKDNTADDFPFSFNF